ncbi:MAG: DUF2127 domain-containing protein [Actinomycetota bacterium]|nr:DUF2127 domain-containing protein [Actinomycetota bacterium]
MRLVPRHWHSETWVCSMRGHVTPAAEAQRLQANDRRLGIDLGDGTRFVRCLRCDAWLEATAPEGAEIRWETLPPVRQLPLPRRGKPLTDAVLLRIIALSRALHSVVFGLLALALAGVELKLPVWRGSLRHLSRQIDGLADHTGPDAGRDWLSSALHRALRVNSHTLTILLVTAIIYCVVEGTEAVGLWRERRWAEYLTAVATVGFLPFEVHELIDRVTVLRILALVVNLAILGWLVWNKHLFGVRGGEVTLHEHTDWDDILSRSDPARGKPADPAPAGAATVG